MTELPSIDKEKPAHLKLGAQARRAHVKAYMESKQSMVSYSRAHHIPESTFYSWVQTYGNKVNAQTHHRAIGTFISIEHAVDKKSAHALSTAKQELHIKVGHDVMLVIPELVDVKAVAKLIRGLSSCS